MPAGRIVLFGATGYTGRLTAKALTRAGHAPLLAGRSAERLQELTEQLTAENPNQPAPQWQVADVAEPASVRALLESPDDVLVTTVGPFARLGNAALDAAIDVGAGYVDCTGEHTFIRHVFTEGDERATRTGARLLCAFGYDYVPGNLAGALALRDVSDAIPAGIDIGYFIRGPFGISSGTRASAVGMLLEPSFAYQRGALTTVRTARNAHTFTIDGRAWQGLSIGGSEHFTLPRIAPELRDIAVYLGWAGRYTPLAQAGSLVFSALRHIPGIARLGDLQQHTGTGPDPEARSKARSMAVAVVSTSGGQPISEVVVEGPTPYELTAETLAWGAAMLQAGRAMEVGALGPADAFGLDALVAGCAAMGLRQRP